MSLVSIGPIALGDYEHGNPSYSWGANPESSPASISGLLTWVHAKQLRALVRFGKKTTIEGAHGVLEQITFAGDLFSDLSGMYVLTGFSSDPSKGHTMSADTCPFTLTGAYIGDVGPGGLTLALEAQLVTIPDLVGVAARTVVAVRPSEDDAVDDEMAVVVNGVETIREFDPELEQP